MKQSCSCLQSTPSQVLVTVQAIAATFRVLDGWGLSRESLLDGTGLVPADLNDPGKLVTHAQELAVMANARRLCQDDSIAMQAGVAMRVSSYGLLGYAMLVSPTLNDALHCIFDFPLLYGSHFEIALRVDGYSAALVLGGYRYDPNLALWNTDMELAELWTAICDVLADKMAPDCVALTCSRPQHASAYRQVFGASTYFERNENAIYFPAELLEMAPPLADPHSYEVMRKQCEQLQESRRQQSDTDIVARIMSCLNTDAAHFGHLANMAAELCLSERTLRRRLEERGLNFQMLLDEVLHEKSLALLAGSIPLGDIAESLGYSDAAAFRHAFRRWTGMTPKEFRDGRGTVLHQLS